MPSTHTEQRTYTLGQLTRDLGALKEMALDQANNAYRTVHRIEDIEEAIDEWKRSASASRSRAS